MYAFETGSISIVSINIMVLHKRYGALNIDLATTWLRRLGIAAFSQRLPTTTSLLQPPHTAAPALRQAATRGVCAAL